MHDDRIDVTELLFVNDAHVGLTWNNKVDFVEAFPNTNVILAAYTTAQARLCLYTILGGLEDRVLYMDTDSAIYINIDGEWNPPLGDYLADLKDETKGVPITAFVLEGPKSYVYQLEDGKGMCQNSRLHAQPMEFGHPQLEALQNLVTTPGELLKSSNEKIVCEIKDPYKIIRKEGHLYTKPQNKQYKLVYDKRIFTDMLKTYPFGWK